jgi:ligand-binding sensor domain-containing protein
VPSETTYKVPHFELVAECRISRKTLPIGTLGCLPFGLSGVIKGNMFRSLAIAFLIGCSAATIDAATLKGQAVTYSDFNFVNYVAASMNHVYYATTQGIIRYDKLREKWEDPLTGTEGIDNEDISKIWVDVFDSRLIAQTSAGLLEYDTLFNRWYPLDELPEQDNQNDHLEPAAIMHPPIGFTYEGDGRIVDRYNRSFYLNDILDDFSGTLWIGTWGHGPAKAGRTARQIELMPYGLLQKRVNALIKQDSLLWLSGEIFDSYRSGITVFDLRDSSFRHIESGLDRDFPAVDVNCLDADDTCLYVGTPTGLYCLDKRTEIVNRKFSSRSGLSEDYVSSVKVVGDSIFVGTTAGLNIISMVPDSIHLVRPEWFLDELIYDLEQVETSLWIATSSGAYRLKLTSGALQKFEDPDLVLFGDVYDVACYGNDLWFASDDGLVRLDRQTGDSEPFRLTSEKIRPRVLAVNDTIVAVASDKGMTLLFYKNKKPFTRLFTTDDGLPSNTVYTLLIDGDYLWIGTDEGLTRFLWNNPDRID